MKNKALFSLLASMIIFGTIGIFRRYIPFPSGFVAFSRGIIGFSFLLGYMKLSGKSFSFAKTKRHFPLLCLSGILMGFNWILLFEAYNHTSIAAATLCYYMAPVFVIIASPFFFREKLGAKKLICVFAALSGMIFVSEIFKSGFSFSEIKGVLFGLFAAVLYSSVVIINKKTPEAPAFDKTAIQLGSAAAILLPYTLSAEEINAEEFSIQAILMLAAVGIIHTGIAYLLYFGSIGKLPAQTAAIFSYVDPVSAIFLSVLIFGEGFSLSVLIGSILILGSAVVSETDFDKFYKKEF